MSVTYATTTGGTATAGTDYTTKTGTLSWAAGDATNRNIVIPIINDTTVEATETIRLTLSNAVGGSLGTPNPVFLSITDNDVCATPTNLLRDPTFEAGQPWTGWTIQGSTINGTPLCNGGCGGDGTSAGPQNGVNWAWFGGVESKATIDKMGQSVVFPAGRSLSLRFALKVGSVTAPYTDILRVKIDNTVVFTQSEPATAQTAFKTYTINVSNFANGVAHTVLFEYVGVAGGGNANFNVDNVYLYSCPLPTATVATTSRTSEISAPATTVSPVTLSSALARAGADSVELAFTGSLLASFAGDPLRYSVTADGQPLPVESATYSATSNRVFLTVPMTALAPGMKVVVKWNDLRDSANRTLSGESHITAQ
jgi:hypothetical protein